MFILILTLTVVYVFLLKWITKPLLYTSLVFIALAKAAIILYCLYMWNTYKNSKKP